MKRTVTILALLLGTGLPFAAAADDLNRDSPDSLDR